jgi:hypothetical protein
MINYRYLQTYKCYKTNGLLYIQLFLSYVETKGVSDGILQRNVSSPQQNATHKIY